MSKSTITKEKVIARLIKCGHNPENASKWVEEHYDYAVKHYTTVSKVAEVIATL
jgi:hypothetical protein